MENPLYHCSAHQNPAADNIHLLIPTIAPVAFSQNAHLPSHRLQWTQEAIKLRPRLLLVAKKLLALDC
jgi:hypothetical protein